MASCCSRGARLKLPGRFDLIWQIQVGRWCSMWLETIPDWVLRRGRVLIGSWDGAWSFGELLKIWTEKITEIDTSEREKPSLGLLPDNESETISVPRSEKRVEMLPSGEDNELFTNLGVVWRLLEPSWCPHLQASLNEETTERIRL